MSLNLLFLIFNPKKAIAVSDKKILFLCPYPTGMAPSQRFRFEQYFTFLENEGFVVVQKGFLDTETWQILYLPGNVLQKVKGILFGFLKRLLLLFTIGKYHYVFIHREATPLGSPFVEWVIAKVIGKKIIYDFDDAIWLPNTSQQNKIAAFLKSHYKVGLICKWSYKISCGNNYLADFARQFNRNVEIIPTTIDLSYHGRKRKDETAENRAGDGGKSSAIVIGWTGTHSTEKYLTLLLPILKKLEKKYTFVFRVVSNHNPELPLKSFDYVPWNKETEIEDLSKFDIGVMPLEDDDWSKGKCGFKGLQYMAISIPTIMSPVGVNVEIVKNGENGFLAHNNEQWEEQLSTLLENEVLRVEIGKRGFETVKEKYSTHANRTNYLKLFA